MWKRQVKNPVNMFLFPPKKMRSRGPSINAAALVVQWICSVVGHLPAVSGWRAGLVARACILVEPWCLHQTLPSGPSCMKIAALAAFRITDAGLLVVRRNYAPQRIPNARAPCLNCPIIHHAQRMASQPRTSGWWHPNLGHD